ncbi:MAG: O-antigen ligase family protein [Candidatus Rokubacteria bacterium]|nr:O-antigen ligase family protein [Candidatus Rokubacteria bacterium]
MNPRVDASTVVSLLVAGVLALTLSAVVSRMPLDMSLGVGLVLVVLVIAVASNELALYLLILSMLLGPQVLIGELGRGATLGRGLTLRLDDILIVIVGLAWLGKTALYKEFGLVFRTPLNRPIAAYTVAAMAATGLGMMAGRVTILGGTFFVMKYVQYFAIYFMVVNNLRERRQVARFVVVLLVTAAIVSVIGILQIPSGERVSAPFEGSKSGEPNTFGGYLVLVLALVASLHLTTPSLTQKFWLFWLAGVVTLPLLFTLSRSSYLGLLVLAGSLFAWSDRRLLLASALAIGLALAPFVLPKPTVDRVLFTFTQPVHEDQVRVGTIRLDTSTSDRLRSWREVVVEDWPKQPILGYGVTGYRFLDAQYPRVLAETGIVGLVAFLWLQTSLFREARAVLGAARDPLFRGVALGFLTGYVALIAHSIGSNTFIIVRIMEPFWFLAGIVVMIPRLEAAEPHAAAPPPRHGRSWSRPAAPAPRPARAAGGR